MNRLSAGLSAIRGWGRESLALTWVLVRVMVPVMLVVKILDDLGATSWLATALKPLMSLLGLPEALGLVWAAAMLTNIYAGLAVFYQLAPGLAPLSVAQVTVLATVILVAHSLPVEARVAQRAGMPLRTSLVLRIGGALLLGALLNQCYQLGGFLPMPAELLWEPSERLDPGWIPWAREQGRFLLVVLLVIAALLALMRLLRYLGVQALLKRGMQPWLRMMGIGPAASEVVIVGMTLGLSYGAGLLIREADSGRVPARDLFGALALLGLCHSLIEDTLLLMLIGAHPGGILGARVLFALLVVAACMHLYQRLPAGWRPPS